MADDADLEAIRQKRLAQLQGQYGAGGGGVPNVEEQQKAVEKKHQMEEARSHMLTQVLTPEARERLSRIALVKPDKARSIEDTVIRAAQMGQLQQQVDEPKLIQMLEQISEKKTETKITFNRRKYSDDED